MPPDGKKTKLGSSKQGASPSAGNNTEVVLVPCHAFPWVWIFPRSWVSSVTIDESSVRATKITSRIGVS